MLKPLTAGLALSAAGSASSQVVGNTTPIGGSTGIFNQNFAITPGNDFTFHSESQNTPNKPTSTVSITPMTGAALTGELALNDLVGPGGSFSTSVMSVPGGQHYYGFSLTEDSTLYGWLSITHNVATGNGTGTGTIDAWAYEASGAGIAAGSVSAIPEPASSAAVAALLAGSAVVWQRRRKKLEAARAA